MGNKFDFFETNTGKILRWIFFIPIGLLSGFLISLLALGFTYIRAKYFGGEGQWDLMISPYFFYITFCYVSWFILPKYKSKIIGYLILLKVLFSIYLLFSYSNYDTSLSKGMFIIQEVFTALSCFILTIFLSAKYGENEGNGMDNDNDNMFDGIDKIMGESVHYEEE